MAFDYATLVFDNVLSKIITMFADDAAFAVQNFGTRYSYVTNPAASVLPPSPSNALLTGNLTPAQIASIQPSVNFRNIIDGGDFTVNPWQRGTSFAAIAGTSTYTADRWVAAGNNASASVNVSKQAVTAIPGFGQALQLQRTAANADTHLIRLQQLIESFDIIRLQGQQVCVSFWALAGANFSAVNGSLGVVMTTGTTADEGIATYLTGFTGAATLPVQSGGGVQLTPGGAWARYYATFFIPTNAQEAALEFNFTPVGTAGTNDWVQIMGVQVEQGGFPSLFEHRDVQVELEICQRYCSVVVEPAAGIAIAVGYSSTTTAAFITMALPQPMRVAPAVSFTGTALSASTFKVGNLGTPIVLSTPFLAAGTGHTVLAVNLTATTGSTQTAGQGVSLMGAGGGAKIVISADL